MNDRLSTIGSIGHRDRSRVIAAQETSQADEPQEAEEAPLPESSSSLASVRVTGGAWPICPAGACASATAGDPTATRAARSTTTANTVRLQDGPVMGLRSIQMVHTGYGRLHSIQASRE
jgi:hypothetical protein